MTSENNSTLSNTLDMYCEWQLAQGEIITENIYKAGTQSIHKLKHHSINKIDIPCIILLDDKKLFVNIQIGDPFNRNANFILCDDNKHLSAIKVDWQKGILNFIWKYNAPKSIVLIVSYEYNYVNNNRKYSPIHKKLENGYTQITISPTGDDFA